MKETAYPEAQDRLIGIATSAYGIRQTKDSLIKILVCTLRQHC